MIVVARGDIEAERVFVVADIKRASDYSRAIKRSVVPLRSIYVCAKAVVDAEERMVALGGPA